MPRVGMPMRPAMPGGDAAGGMDTMRGPAMPKGVMGTFKEGGDVPMTGAYKLHKGEKVLTKDQKDHMQHAFGLAQAHLAHEKMPEMEHKAPKKKIKDVRVRKSHNGGYIMHHTHHAPHHGSEHDTESVAANKEEMLKHMSAEQNQPEPPPQEEQGESAGLQQMESAIGMK